MINLLIDEKYSNIRDKLRLASPIFQNHGYLLRSLNKIESQEDFEEVTIAYNSPNFIKNL
jgi:hypothetical protein